MKTTSQITIESKLGRFTFGKDVPMALAKLLRDTVTGQYFNQQQGNRVKDEDSAQEFVYEHCCRDLSLIPFKLEFAEEFRPATPKWIEIYISEEDELMHFMDEEAGLKYTKAYEPYLV